MKKLLIAIGFVMAASAARASTYIPVLMSTATNPAVQAGSSAYSFHVGSGTVDHFTAPSITVGTMTATGFTVTSGTFTWVGASTIAVNGNTLVATAGTRTWTLPDLGGNYSVVGSSGSQTLSNKTFDNATLSNALNANSQKIVNITSGTANSDAARYSQVKILQVVYASVNTSSSTTGNSFINTNLTATITPTSTSSQILIFATGSLSQAAAGFSGLATIARGSTNLYAGDTNSAGAVARGDGASNNYTMGTMIKRDSPATTSPTTYTVQIETLSGSGSTVYGGQTNQTMVLVEVNGL